MDTGLASIIVALILGCCSIISSIIFGYLPRKRKEHLIRVKKELLELYKDVEQLLDIQEQLLSESETSKKIVRQGKNISYRCEKGNVRKRIRELSAQLKIDK